MASYFSRVDQYQSENEESENETSEEEENLSGKQRNVWTNLNDYATEVEALKYLKDQNFVKRSSNPHNITTGRKRKDLFRCSAVKAREKQCELQLQLVYEKEDVYHVQHNGRAHTCDQIPETSKAVPELEIQVIKRIQSLFRSGTRMPKSVQRTLRDDHARNEIEYSAEPTINQIKYQIRKYKDNEFGGSEISLGELETFLKENSNVPQDIDEPFVLDFSIKYGKNNTLDISDENMDIDAEEGEESSFWFLFSTIRLVRLITKTTLIAADSTFKLVWQGYPGILLGTIDMKKQYHKIAFGMTSSEKTSDWTEIFEAIKKKGEQILKKEIKFETLLADCAFEIRNGFLSTFPDGTVINCNFHVQKNIEKRAKKDVKDEKKRKQVLSDIKTLQLSQSKEVFDEASKLLINEWKEKTPEFIKYFEENYILQRSNWYEGIAMLSPSTNNALESTNGKIKLLFTNKRRVTMQEMKNISATMIQNWSQDLANEKPFEEKVSFTDQEITAAYIWMKQKDTKVLKEPDQIEDTEGSESSTTSYWVAAKGEKDLKSRMIRDIKDLNFNTFDEFKQKNFRAHKVIIHRPIEEPAAFGLCTCKDFFKNFKCVHVLGIAIRMKDFEVSPDLKQKAKQQFESSVPLPGKKRKAGRPKNATPALQRD